MRFIWKQLAMAAAACVWSTAAHAQTRVETDALNRTPPVREAFAAFYAMDYETAFYDFEQIAAAHPESPLATDFLMDAVVIRELNRQDLLDTTFYANDGFLSGKHIVREDPAVRDRVRALASKAGEQADALLANRPHDVDALYARGWSRALLAVYTALVEREFIPALKLAIAAKNDEEEVLKLDPQYVDADLIVGTYQYVVGALPFQFRLLVGMVGLSGNKQKGMALLQDAAAHGVLTSVDARTCMMLFLRREAKYGQARQTAAGLAKEYPHGYLFQLELANLEKDAGDGEQAIERYQRVLAQAKVPGYFHNAHLELGYFGLADTLRGEKKYAQAAEAYTQAADAPTTSPELKQRCLVAAGKSYDLNHDHARAAESYQAALDAGGPDTVQGQEARKLIRRPWEGA